MKVYLLDDKRITKCNLPSKVEEDFLINYSDEETDKDNILTIEANNGRWFIRSNGSINIVNGDHVEPEVVLENYSYHYLKVLGKKNYVVLFSMPSQESELYTLSYNSLNEIKIGNDQTANICFKNMLTTPSNATIYKENDSWYLKAGESLKLPIFVNDAKVSQTKLKYGDLIFINGLKIIWMKDYIKINNPGKKVTVTGLAAYNIPLSVDNSYTPVSDEENSISLYSENDYFYHIPRVKEVIRHEEVSIDSPPGSQISQELPAILTIGSSLTMFASTFLMGYNLYNNYQKGSDIKSMIPQVVMLFAMLVGAIIMPRVLKLYQKRMAKKREKMRKEKYQEYLNSKTEEIQKVMKHQFDILCDNNLNAKQCYDIVMSKDRNLWSREIADDDFLNIRVGIGDYKTELSIHAPEEHFSLDKDVLFESVYKVVEQSKKIAQTPVVYSLLDHNIVSFIFNCSYKYDYIKSLLAQIITYHSGNDLKIAIFTNKYNEEHWRYVKIRPHCWSSDRSVRYYATNVDEANQVSSALDEELKLRKELLKENSENVDSSLGYKNFDSYFLIITDDYRMIKNCSFVENILKEKVNLGFSFVTIADSMKNLPPRTENFIQISEKNSCILYKELDTGTQTQFENEYFPGIDMEAMSIKLANIPLLGKEGLTVLPSSLNFLEMFNASKIEQLNILNRWQVNNPVTSLATTIGVHSNLEPFKLDLHEKFHGPHGLVAGSTGSGKSEFIITYILSMALNYHPYEVQFVLIDYKGGGLAGAFENRETGVRLPHLIGTITNLDTSEMNRTLVSIESELKRRQKTFNKVRDSLGESTIDIYKYQRLYREGVVKEPMAHLFIISDEFAELKSQQPEFMAQLISTARIGRSLGVHLILATQKPSGVVNDQIWSNSKFKVCLKVQDRSDSMEMLKKPDAASIKEAGRFYLQVGYDDYFDIGQSGWSGAKYIPTNKIIKKVDDSMSFVNNVGFVFKSANDTVKKDTTIDLGDQLTNIVKYIYNLGIKEKIVTKKLWLDKIPSEISIIDIKKKYNYKPTAYEINPVIGEYDNPSAQEQGILNLDLTHAGNTIIFGQSGSGKENLISTILWSSITEHTPDEVSFYIIDCGAETLKMFYKMPHVGEITNIEESEKIFNIFDMVSEELEKRKDLFADYAGSYLNYLENSGKKLPLIVVIINGYDNFAENYGKVSEGIMSFYRECVKYGIVFIISTSTPGIIRAKMLQNFANKISLQLPNEGDYRNVLGAPRNLFPAKTFGRGIAYKNDTFYEFQTANIADAKQMNNVIKAAAAKLNEAYKTCAKKLITIPPVVNLGMIKDNINDITKLPIGFDTEKKEISYYNFMDNKINLILSNDMAEKMDFIYALIRESSLINNVKTNVIDLVGAMEKQINNINLVKDNFSEEFKKIASEIKNDQNSAVKNLYFIICPGFLKSKLSDNDRLIVNEIFETANKLVNTSFILIDDYANAKVLKLESWYQTEIDSSSGIWIGDGVGDQMAININNLSIDDRKLDFPYLTFAVKRGKKVAIKCVIDEEISLEQGEILSEE